MNRTPTKNTLQPTVQKVLLILLILCSASCTFMDTDIFGRYHFVRKYYNATDKKEDIAEEIFIQLNSDNTYHYLVDDLFRQAADTGVYSVRNDTLYFTSEYKDTLMHKMYAFFVDSEVFFEDRWDDRLRNIDISEWYYVRLQTRVPGLFLKSGFHMSLGNFSHSYSGNLADNDYEICLPKKHFRDFAVNDLKIHFPDLNLVVKGFPSSRDMKFEHALICELNANIDNPDGYFMTPKTLQNQKMVLKGDSLMFVREDGTTNEDLVLKSR